jgi:cob(I)alamin adenosyltransferase
VAKVTTRGGDAGYTGLLGAERVAKYDARIEALGLVDEATSALGLARASAADERVRAVILGQQQTLYRLMAELAATPEATAKLALSGITASDVAGLEDVSDELKREVEIGNRFVIPGESVCGAAIDLARTVVRRAERHVARMTHEGEVPNPDVLRYLNRLSDTLFILARYVERGHVREAS